MLVKCECHHCVPIPQNTQYTQYNAPVETGTGTTNIESKGQSSLSYWEYESIQARCIQLQEKNDQLRDSLEREVKAKLAALTDMQKELAKGEVARIKVDQLEAERKDLRETLEQAKERAERVLFRKDQQFIDYCPTDSMMQNTDPNDHHSSLLQKLVSEANEVALNKNDDDMLQQYGNQSNLVVKQVPDLPESFPGPIIGCKCSTCKAFFRSASISGQNDFAELGIFQQPKMHNSLKRFKQDLNRLTLLRNCKLHLEVGQRILVKRNRVGTIRYLGHLEKSSRKTMVNKSLTFW